jgi:hypothetical protein
LSTRVVEETKRPSLYKEHGYASPGSGRANGRRASPADLTGVIAAERGLGQIETEDTVAGRHVIN